MIRQPADPAGGSAWGWSIEGSNDIRTTGSPGIPPGDPGHFIQISPISFSISMWMLFSLAQ